MALHPKGVNHLALSTNDMKGQLEFFCDVLGCPLKALYWMHGVANTFHGFVELSPESYVAFVQSPNNPKDCEIGVTHAGNPTGTTTAGTMQHVSFHVDTFEELLAMRDRIRSRGVPVLGPIDHGMIQSMYFAGPEGLVLEISCGHGIDPDQWVDPEVVGLCAISDEELARLRQPEPFKQPATAVPQPPRDPAKPVLLYPPAVYERVLGVSDDEVWRRFSETTAPVPLRS